jgi:hypothetical protein
MKRDRDKELQELLQMAHQNGAPIFTPEPIAPPNNVGYEVKIVVSESGTEVIHADS